MINISLSFSVLCIILGLYWIILGIMLVMQKKVLDIYTIIIIWFIRMIQGQEISASYRDRIYTTRNFKFYGVYFIISGILFLLFVLIVNT